MKKTTKDLKDNYVVIQSWMVRELGLKANSAILYALIYGFSQTDGQVCTCGDEYMAAWIGVTTRAVINLKNDLIARGLIVKTDGFDGDKRVSGYKVVRPKTGEKTSCNSSEICENVSHNRGKKYVKSFPKIDEDFSEICEDFSPDNKIYKNNITDLSVSHSARTRETDGLTDEKFQPDYTALARARMRDAGIDESGMSAKRLLGIFEEIGRRKQVKVGGAPIDKDALCTCLLELCDDAQRLWQATAKGECTDDGQTPKNKFGYMVTTLYNYVNNF